MTLHNFLSGEYNKIYVGLVDTSPSCFKLCYDIADKTEGNGGSISIQKY